MKIHRFYIETDYSNKKIKFDDGELLNQLKKVLRLRIGDSVVLFNKEGKEFKASIESYTSKGCVFNITKIKENNREIKNTVLLYCSILKRDNFEFVVQKATEIGIDRITPIVTSRTIKFDLRSDRLGKIIKEASEQSGRVKLPILSDKISLKESMDSAKKNNAINIFFDSAGKNINELMGKNKIGNKKNQIGIFIGPEGGWTNEELELAKKSNFKIISLGETTLRAETAAIISTYISVNLI